MKKHIPVRQDYEWGYMVWTMDKNIDPSAAFSTARMVVWQEKMSELHSHNNCDEFIFLEKGEAEVQLNDKREILTVDTGILIPKNTKHAVKNIGNKPVEISLTYSSGCRDYTPHETL